MNSDENTVAAQAAPTSPLLEKEESKPEVSAAAPEISQQTSSNEDNAEAAAKAAKPEEPESMDANVRIAKDSSVRKLISFVMSRLERGGTVTLQALNLCVKKAITIALIALSM